MSYTSSGKATVVIMRIRDTDESLDEAVQDIFGTVERLCLEGAWAALRGDVEALHVIVDQAEQLLIERARHATAWPDAASMS